jgi:hypothetical protein
MHEAIQEAADKMSIMLDEAGKREIAARQEGAPAVYQDL